MRIGVAQTRPTPGDIQRNIECHGQLIDVAVTNRANLVVFPELSLTGYEPKLAKDLATDPHDRRFDDFQNTSDAKQITIGVGVPTRLKAGICISLVLFQPHQVRQLYSKMHLHPDEEEFFICGQKQTGLIGHDGKVALAICYELSVPEHAAGACKNGAKIYIASVAKAVDGIQQATERLAEIAREYSMTVLMSNCVGRLDGCECAGKSSVWDDKGELLGQLDGAGEGIVIFDTETRDVTTMQC